MIRILLYIFIVAGLSQKTIAQVNNDTLNPAARFDTLKSNYFKKYNHSNLEIEYFFTDGFSEKERYAYRIVIIDSMLTLTFESPNTDSYNAVLYKNKTFLTKKQIGVIKNTLVSSNLRQVKKGIPLPNFSACTREVLIIKYKNINIVGGLTYGNVANYPDSENRQDVNKEISEDRKQSSSIEGDYDSMISILRRYFPNLKKLKEKAIRK